MRLGMVGGGTVLLLIVVGTLIARAFVYRRLGPIVETSVGNLIDRPVEIGPIKGFSLTSIDIDGAAIPPTVDDEDYAKVPEVEVSFNPVAVLFNLARDRTLPITLTFRDPELYLQEDEDGRWVELEIQRPEQEAAISLALETIRVEEATVIAAPFPQSVYSSVNPTEAEVDPVDLTVDPEENELGGAIAQTQLLEPLAIAQPVTLANVGVMAHLRDNNRYLDADVDGEIVGGGTFELKSDVDFKQLGVNAHLRSQKVQVTSFDDVVKAFAPLPGTLQSGDVDTNLTIRYAKDKGLSCEGTVQVNNVAAVVDLEVSNVDFQPISEVNGLLGCADQTITLDGTTLKYGTVPIKASGSVDLDEGYDLTAQIPKLTLEQVQETLLLERPVEADGTLRTDVAITGPLAQPFLTGSVRNVGPVQVDQLGAEALNLDFNLTPALLNIVQLTVLPQVGGTVNGKGQVTFADGGGIFLETNIQSVPTDAIADLYNIPIPDPVQLGDFNSTIDVFGDFSNVQAAVQWSLPDGTYPGSGNVLYGDQTVRVRNTSIQLSQGNLDLTANAFLDREEWDATVAVDGLDVPALLTQLSVETPPGARIQGVLSSDVELAGNFRQLTPEAIAIQGTATLAAAEVALADTPILDQGDWNTNFQWTGQDLVVQQFTAPGVAADGVISTNLQTPITPATAIRQLDLNVAVAPYDLNRLQAFIPANIQTQIQQQVAPRLSGPVYPQGQAQFEGTLTGTLTQPRIDGTAQLDNLAIASFRFGPTLTGPVNFALGTGGSVDLNGGGDRIYARLDERYLPTDFEIRDGSFAVVGAVEGDRLTASVDSFDVATLGIQPLPRADLGPVQGVVDLDLIANVADLANPRIDSQITIERPGLGAIAAEVFTGTLSYRDGIAVLDDGFFCLGPEQLPQAEQSPTEGASAPNIAPGDMPFSQRCYGKSQFRLASVMDVFDLAVEQSQLTIQNGDIQDILTTLQWYDIDDARRWLDFSATAFTAGTRGSAADVNPDTVALPPTALLNRNPEAPQDKLGYFAQWLEQWQQARDANREVVPSLQDLAGQFDGTLSLNGSMQTGFNLNFDLMGDDWTWGPYQEETRFIASGSVSPNAITLAPFQAASGDARVMMEGQIGLAQPGTSTLNVQNVPMPLLQEVAQQFVPALESLPADVDGVLQTNATLNGTLANPQLGGTVIVNDPTINQTPLAQVAVDFEYEQARFTADSVIVLQDQEKLTLKADIPYALPFMAVQPADDRIAINANIRDEGLALINLFTQGQATWDGGRGALDMGINGTLSSPEILGTLQLSDGQVSSPLLTRPITGITGTSEFNLERIRIPELRAEVDTGDVVIQGELPLFAAIPANNGQAKSLLTKPEPESLDSSVPEAGPIDGLAIAINALPLGITDLLRATVDGDVMVRGAAIAPSISGDVGVFRGRVDVAGVASRGGAAEDQAPNPFLQQVTLDNLRITLEDQLQIASRPLFDIETIGSLEVSGTLADLRADGDIELASGWINLFATQFRLDRGENHFARFQPNRAIADPILDVTMNAVVREVERRPVPPSSPFAGAEVADQSSIPTFGGLQSVVIIARVDGSARHLLDHLTEPDSTSPNPLTLTSDPGRSETQLVALLGGEIFSALESGNTGLALASYVGSGFVANVGDQIADALGLSEFSIFPTTDVSGESSAPIAVGVEAGLDIIPRQLSFSLLEILDGTTNPQYGLRYRLSDEWQIRGSSDLNQDNRAILEFRTDF